MRMNSGIAARTRNARRMGAALALAVGALGAGAATAAAAPSLTVTPASNLDPSAANSLAVTGNGFTSDLIPADRAGVYAALTATVEGSILADQGNARFFPTVALASGTFNTTLTVNRRFTSGSTEVDCLVTQCVIRSWLAHDTPSAENTLATRAITFDVADPGTPEVTVTPRTDIPREGETTVTISGRGFDPNVNNGNGFYIAYGPRNAANYWLSTKGYGATKWVRPGGSVTATQDALNPDGTFSTTLTVKPTYTGGDGNTYDCRVISCSIITFAAQGSSDRSFDTDTPLTFAPPPPAAEVSPVTNLNRDGATTVTVRGSNFQTGTYVSVTAVVDGQLLADQANAKWVRRGGPTPDQTINADGSFETAVSVNPTFTSGDKTVDCRVTQCAISTWRQHSNPTVDTLYTTTPIAFAAAPIVDPPVEQPKGPQASVTKVKAQLLGSKLGARVGFLTCKTDCTVKAPKSVKVKIGKKKYTATVVVPKTGKAGKRFQVRVKLTKAAAKALAGRSAKVSVKVTLTADGMQETKTVSATVKAKKAKKAVKQQARAKR